MDQWLHESEKAFGPLGGRNYFLTRIVEEEFLAPIEVNYLRG